MALTGLRHRIQVALLAAWITIPSFVHSRVSNFFTPKLLQISLQVGRVSQETSTNADGIRQFTLGWRL